MKIVVCVHALLLLLAFQNCGRNLVNDTQWTATQSSTTTTPSLLPLTEDISSDPALSGKLDPNCKENTAYDTCIFFKNPISQRGSPFPGGGIQYSSDLSALQIYGVKLAGLTTPDALENSSIRVTMSQAPASQRTKKVDWKKPYAGDPNHHTSQLMAYYWLNYQLVAMKKKTSVMYTENKSIEISTLNESLVNNAAWTGTRILMGVFTTAGRSEAALNAEVYLHEMGHANLQFATNGANADDPNTEVGGGRYWCITAAGCMSAINEGQADFHYLMLFPQKPALGETLSNTVEGVTSCGGISRDVTKTGNLTAASAYAACANVPGEGHVMGTVYATLWWDIYTAAGAEGRSDIEKMFAEHMRELRGADRFAEAGAKILNVDKALFGGKYATSIRAALTKRGIATAP